ncbi:MAG: single-stranded-DNA-specific exonuclease RecJ [Acetobacter sp.]|nr:single-stranded-DNA-specific exonuclease RecJ [Acetobacter sp.]
MMHIRSVATTAVRGVEASLTGRRWIWRHVDDGRAERLALALSQRFGLSALSGTVLARRGVTPDDAGAYLDPTLRELMPNPSSLMDMDKVAERLARAISQGETVGVYGDYDVDGACASALLTSFLTGFGCRVFNHIPDRLKEGYGPNVVAMDALSEQGATLIVCVDCGTASSDVFAAMKSHPDIVVIDHHIPEGPPPPVFATVNPQRSDCGSGLRTLCATALTFMTVVAALRVIRRDALSSAPLPDLRDALDLVALATVCDVMPLTGLNRAFVTQGLKIMNRRKRIGLGALMEAAGVSGEPTAFSCGYALGPRVNAGGRIADASLGMRLLLEPDADRAQTLAQQLGSVNRTRQEVEQDILARALQEAESQIEAGRAVVLVASEDWHPGVVGIIAGRIRERFNRPALVAAIDEEGILRGSGRSIPGCDLGRVVIAARQQGLLITGGGHAMAAGFGLSSGNRETFHDFADGMLADARQAPDVPPLVIDAVMPLSAANADTAQDLSALEPFGAGNEEPVLVIENVRVSRADRIGKDNGTLRVILTADVGQPLKALMFRCGDSPVAAVLEDRQRPLLHVAGCLRKEVWNGRESTTFFISDVALA